MELICGPFNDDGDYDEEISLEQKGKNCYNV